MGFVTILCVNNNQFPLSEPNTGRQYRIEEVGIKLHRLSGDVWYLRTDHKCMLKYCEQQSIFPQKPHTGRQYRIKVWYKNPPVIGRCLVFQNRS